MFLADILYEDYQLNSKSIKAEAAICIEFANKCRAFSRSGELKALWFTVPNEARRSIWQRTILRAMGLLPGAPDYVFIGRESSVCLEFKTPKGVVSPAQKNVSKYCNTLDIPYFVVRNVNDALDILESFGLLLYVKVIQKEAKEGKSCVLKDSGKNIHLVHPTQIRVKPLKKRTTVKQKTATAKKTSSKRQGTTPAMRKRKA